MRAWGTLCSECGHVRLAAVGGRGEATVPFNNPPVQVTFAILLLWGVATPNPTTGILLDSRVALASWDLLLVRRQRSRGASLKPSMVQLKSHHDWLPSGGGRALEHLAAKESY